jgi:Xaa-Pro dipeptidase
MTGAPLPATNEHIDRVAATQRAMAQQNLDVLCLTGPEDIYYLSGLDHQGYFAFTMLVVPATGQPVVVARHMEATTMRVQVPQVRHQPYRDFEDPADAVLSVLRAQPDVARVGVDEAGMWFPVEIHHRVAAGLPGAQLVDGSRIVPELRSVKSPTEQACIREAAALSSRGINVGIEAIAVGVNARDVAAAVYAEMIGHGSDPPGCAPFIRFRDALLQEHRGWEDRAIAEGDSVFFELSASVKRYHAPLTRMVYVGEPPPGTDRAGRIASDALDAVTAALRPGVPAGSVYAEWQRVVDEGLGHRDYRRHHCGYQVGIGFPPSWVGGPHVVGLRSDATWPVEEGMTFHVLSWLLDQQPADFVLSDTVLATAQGGEVLTVAPREPIVVPA